MGLPREAGRHSREAGCETREAVLSKGLEARRVNHGKGRPERRKGQAQRSGSDPLLKAKLEQARASK